MKKLSQAVVLLILGEAGLFAQYAPARAEWNRAVEPFRIIGNIYYVGASDVSSFLITTPKGHILIDTGFAETVPLIESNLRRLGFHINDIRVLLASHAHYDHAGGVAELKSRTKARFLANPAEVDLFERGGKGDFAFGDAAAFPPVKPDGLLRDGGVVELGGVAVKTIFTPGHTKGGVSYALTVREGQKTYEVVIACSLTAPSYQLVDNPLYHRIVEDFESSFAKLRALPCDVFLGGHGWDFGLGAKADARANSAGVNPFVDPVGYSRWLGRSEAALRAQLDSERQAKGIR
jgi:metallo-beta-lactamase class B